MQQKISQSKLILNRNGNLNVSGWSFNNLLTYERSLVKENLSILTERDTYYIYNKRCAVYISLTRRGKKAYTTVIFIDFKRSVIINKTFEKPKLSGKAVMSSSSTAGVTSFEAKDCRVLIKKSEYTTSISLQLNNFNGNSFFMDISLRATTNLGLSTAKDFLNKKGCFVYKNFIPLFSANGTISLGINKYDVSSEDTIGNLIWLRGVIPNNTDVQCLYIGENDMAVSLSNDFGNTRSCNDNFVIYEDKFAKLDDVNISYPEGVLKIWNFKNDEDNVDIKFKPIFYRRNPLYFTFENRILIIGRSVCNINTNYNFWLRDEQHFAIIELEVY